MGSLKDINPSEFTALDEFDDAIDFVNEECNHIEQQIMEAKASALKYGDYSDPEWFSKACSANKIARALKQKLARKRADFVRELKAEEHKKTEIERTKGFIHACRQMLSKEQFLAVWQAVDDKRYEYSATDANTSCVKHETGVNMENGQQ